MKKIQYFFWNITFRLDDETETTTVSTEASTEEEARQNIRNMYSGRGMRQASKVVLVNVERQRGRVF